VTFEWIEKSAVLDAQWTSLRLFGGLTGVRDEGALDSALARPLNKHAYGETDICALAAAYAFGLAKDHPFNDGNKRAAAMVMIAFLRINGHDIRVEKPELTATILALAASEISEERLAAWLRGHVVKRGAAC
jgi:death on curing protein